MVCVIGLALAKPLVGLSNLPSGRDLFPYPMTSFEIATGTLGELVDKYIEINL